MVMGGMATGTMGHVRVRWMRVRRTVRPWVRRFMLHKGVVATVHAAWIGRFRGPNVLFMAFLEGYGILYCV